MKRCCTSYVIRKCSSVYHYIPIAAAAVKSLQSCPTLCDPRDGSPPTPVILQARTLEWVAISFFNAWKWKVTVKSRSRVRLLATPWTAAYQAPPSMGFSRQEYWSGVPLWPKPRTLTTPNGGGRMEQQDLSYTANESAKSTTTMEDSLAVLIKTKHTLPIWFSNYTFWFLPKGVKNLCSKKKKAHKDVYSRFIHNCQNLEANWMALSRWITVAHLDNRVVYLLLKKIWAIRSQKDIEES